MLPRKSALAPMVRYRSLRTGRSFPDRLRGNLLRSYGRPEGVHQNVGADQDDPRREEEHVPLRLTDAEQRGERHEHGDHPHPARHDLGGQLPIHFCGPSSGGVNRALSSPISASISALSFWFMADNNSSLYL